MKRPSLKTISLGAVTLALFTLLYFKSNAVHYSEHDRFERNLRRLKQLDTAFNEDVLKARFRLLNNYDGFGDQLGQTQDALGHLNEPPAFVSASARAQLQNALTRFSEMLTEKKRLLEDFKSQNSVLRNSLAYFPTAGSELVKRASASEDSRELELCFSELMRGLLVFALTSDEDLEPQVRASIARVREWAAAHRGHPDAVLASSLAAHAKAIVSRKPAVEALTRDLVSIPTAQQTDAVLHLYEDSFAEALEAAQIYRLLLYICCVLLLGGIAYALGALRSANYHLERRVEDRTQDLLRNNVELQKEITERCRTENELRSSEELLSDLFDNATIGVHLLGPDGTILRANCAELALLGLQPGEYVGHSITEFHADTAGGADILQRLTRGETLHQYEARLRARDGTIKTVQMEASVRRVKGQFIHSRCFTTDITAQKQAEEERKAMEVQLRHAQKMESIGQLAAGIAHEINTPTQFIGDNTRFVRDAFADMLTLAGEQGRLLAAAKEGKITPELIQTVEAAVQSADLNYLSEEIPKAIGQSLEGVDRVAKIVLAMKDFSHPGTDTKVALDLNRSIESTLTVCRSEWKFVAEMVTDFDAKLPLVPCLPGEINQTILNIVVNATHAIADIVGDGASAKGMITVSTRLDGNWAEIRIRDSGTGIPESARARVFDPFFTTKGVGKGTGQGLAIAHAVIVEKHGGTIKFETETGKGTTFVIRLPLESPPVERKAA